MSEAKHTPGPWTAKRIFSTTCGFIVFDSRGSVVARVQKIGVPQDGNFELPCEENANIIAAVPDLLDALQDLLDVVTGKKQGDSIAVMNAELAIQKATGENT